MHHAFKQEIPEAHLTPLLTVIAGSKGALGNGSHSADRKSF